MTQKLQRKRYGSGYAYRDKYGIMHITQREETAKRFAANLKYAYVEFPNETGYPVLEHMEEIFDYGGEEIYIGGNRNNGKQVSLNDTRIQAYLKEVRGKVDG